MQVKQPACICVINESKGYCVSKCMHRHRSNFITERYEFRSYKFREHQLTKDSIMTSLVDLY